ncbi:MAG TPA: carboxypeptidase-like regulatory domain-containing protein [Vicinamibacterales bacterium]|nr:carboxypeptidase-like regulatory domain-containing protein [Vicinamibacterales bacterium]
MARIATLVMLAVSILAGDAAAQQPRQRAARVDPLTASIRGTVTTVDSGAPVRGAEVRLSSSGRYSRLVTTNGDGRFELRDLPAGEYRMTVSRTGFISLQFGQRRPFEASRAIALAQGQTFTANAALMKGSVIYGRVHDQFGDPLPGTRVQVLRSRMVQGRRRLQSVGGGDQTDDTGAFRVYGLAPGDYYVAASTGLVDTVKRDPPIYYPGTASFNEAQPITLAAGTEATADFQLVQVRNARVSGVVLNSAGVPVPAMVNLTSEAVVTGPTVEGSGPASFALHADAAPNGTFTLENVPPGPYTLTAQLPLVIVDGFAVRDGAPTSRSMADLMERLPETVAMPIVVTGDDVADLTLVTRAGGRLTGRFVADAGVVRPLPSGIRVSVRSESRGGAMFTGGGNSNEFRIGTVTVTGPFFIDVQGLPEGWTVNAIMVDGVDMIDEAIDLKGQNAAVRIVLSDRVTTVSGVVQKQSDAASPSIVVFPDDAARWTYPSRYVRTARADNRGRFQIEGLPPTSYMVAAVDYLEDGDEQDPQFLERLRGRATRFSLRDGEQRSIKLEAVTR